MEKIRYRTVARLNPQNRLAGKKFYARIHKQGLCSLKKLNQLIADRSSMVRGDAESLLSQYLELIPKLLLEGYDVSLGSFGTFSLGIKAKGQLTEEGVTLHTIAGVKVIFTPGTDFKTMLKTAKFEKASPEEVAAAAQIAADTAVKKQAKAEKLAANALINKAADPAVNAQILETSS